MTWTLLLLVLATLASIEIAERLPLLPLTADFSETSKRAWRVLASTRVSDTWKERALPAYSRRMLLLSLRLLVLLAIAAAPIAGIGVLADMAQLPYWVTLSSWIGALLLTVVALFYLAVRKYVLTRLQFLRPRSSSSRARSRSDRGGDF